MNRNHLSHAFILLTSTGALTSAAPRQTNVAPSVAQGAFTAFPAAMQFHGFGTSNAIHLKPVGIQSLGNQPQPITNSGIGPDWSQATFLGSIEFEVDAMSTGNGFFPPPNASHEIVVSPPSPGEDSWAAFTISVKNGAEGTPGSYFEWMTNQGSNGRPAGSELVSYYLPGSVGLAPHLPGATIVEMKRQDMGMALMGQKDLSAFDYALPFLREGEQIAGPVNNNNLIDDRFYFSLSEDWIDQGNNASKLFYSTENYVAGIAPIGDPAAPPHEGDIYYRQWVNSGWSTPVQVVSYSDLNLTAAGDVDAVEAHANGLTVIFSTTRGSFDSSQPASEISQLMYIDLSETPATPRALRGSGGTLIADKLGVKPADTGNNTDGDEVDGACSIDPETSQNALYSTIALPYDYAPQFGRPMGISAARGKNGDAQADLLCVVASGYGNAAPTNDKVRFYVAVSPTAPTQLDPRLDPWILRHVTQRDVLDGTAQYSLPLPPYPNPLRPLWLIAASFNDGAITSVSAVSRIGY